MNKLVMAALLAGGLAQATGCIISSDDPAAQIRVSWQITGDSCPTGGSIDVVAQRVGGQEFTDRFTCVASGEGTTAPLPLGTYAVWVNVVTADETLYAQSGSADITLDLDGEIVPVNFDISSGSAQMRVNWQLTSLGGDPCPANGSVEVVSQRAGGAEFIDIYDCVAGEGVTAAVPLGTYTVWVNVVTADDALWAQSFAADVTLDVDGDIVPVNFDILTDEGFLYATWAIIDDSDQVEVSCANAGAGAVSILSTLVGPNGMGYDDVFTCEDHEGMTSPLPLGEYTVVTSLLDDQDAVLGQSEARSVDILFGNELVDLGNFDFTVP